MIAIIEKFDLGIEKLTKYLLIFCMLCLLVFSTSSIFLRWFHISVQWIEPLIRHLVFLIAFLGGVLATGKKAHIGIDILGMYFENKKNYKAKKIVGMLVSLISCITLIALVYSGVAFYNSEAEYSKVVFWGIKSHLLVAIIPFGFSLMGLRFFLLLLLDIFKKDDR